MSSGGYIPVLVPSVDSWTPRPLSHQEQEILRENGKAYVDRMHGAISFDITPGLF